MTDPKTFWEVWAQPICGGAATLVGATLVYVGVRATLGNNTNRLIKEQLEKRAVDRQKALQDAYSRFAGGVQEYLFASLCVGATLEPIDPPLPHDLPQPTRDRILDLFDEERREASRKQWEARSSLTKAYSELLVLESNPQRKNTLDSYFMNATNVRPQGPTDQYADVSVAVSTWVRTVSVQLETEYQHESKLAREGKNRFGEMVIGTMMPLLFHMVSTHFTGIAAGAAPLGSSSWFPPGFLVRLVNRLRPRSPGKGVIPKVQPPPQPDAEPLLRPETPLPRPESP